VEVRTPVIRNGYNAANAVLSAREPGVICPSCKLENPASARYCDCGYEFVPGSKPEGWVAGRSTREDPGRLLLACLRPGWYNLSISVFAAAFFGMAGLFIYLAHSCWSEHNDCAAYSLPGVAVGGVLSWPILLFLHGGPGADYDPVQRFRWISGPVLWAYYYVIFALVHAAIRSIRSARHRGR
jgi:hypothetical protein